MLHSGPVGLAVAAVVLVGVVWLAARVFKFVWHLGLIIALGLGAVYLWQHTHGG